MDNCPDHAEIPWPKSKTYLRAADGWEFCTMACDFNEIILKHWLRSLDKFLALPLESGTTIHIPDFHIELTYKIHWGRIDEASTIDIGWAYQEFSHYGPTRKYMGLLDQALIIQFGFKAWDEMQERSYAEYSAYLDNVRKALSDA